MPAQFTKEDVIVLAACHASAACVAAHGNSEAAANDAVLFGKRLASALQEQGIVVSSADLRSSLAAEMLQSMIAQHKAKGGQLLDQEPSPEISLSDDVEFDESEAEAVERDDPEPAPETEPAPALGPEVLPPSERLGPVEPPAEPAHAS